MITQRSLLRDGWRAGGAWWLVCLLLLWEQQQQVLSAAAPAGTTAYLVQSMQQPFVASNNSFNNLRGILQRLDAYNAIVLAEDYFINNPKEYAQSDPVRLAADLLITSVPGQRYELSFAFLVRQGDGATAGRC